MKDKNMVLEAGTATITSKNMIVIPKKVREELKLKEGRQVHFVIRAGAAIMHPILTPDEMVGILKSGLTVKELMKEARRNISKFD